MGARQSRRSVDITSGKEGESVAALSAAPLPLDGEARLEKIAELAADVVKPQLNGDAHIDARTPDKENPIQNDNGTLESEKDKSKVTEVVVLSPVNGCESDSAPEDKPKTPDGELDPAADAKVADSDSKKIKKEKVKKKWSFRSISFSKKDKQKPVKKEENGEYPQVPEEAHEAAAPVPTEAIENKTLEEVSPPKEVEKSEEKAPETPVTEPMTNGSTTPESPKEEVRQNGDLSPVEKLSEESTVEIAPKIEKNPAEQPNDLPLNGLHIDDVAQENIQPPAEPTPLPVVTPEPITPEANPDASVSVNPNFAEPISIESPSATLPASEELKMDLSPDIEVSPITEISMVLAESAAINSEPENKTDVSDKIVSSLEPVVGAISVEPVTVDNGVAE